MSSQTSPNWTPRCGCFPSASVDNYSAYFTGCSSGEIIPTGWHKVSIFSTSSLGVSPYMKYTQDDSCWGNVCWRIPHPRKEVGQPTTLIKQFLCARSWGWMTKNNWQLWADAHVNSVTIPRGKCGRTGSLQVVRP